MSSVTPSTSTVPANLPVLDQFTYKKKSGARGFNYEVRMCMAILLRSYKEDLRNFELSYQLDEAGKFDDIVFKKNCSSSIIVLQLKHKETQKEITDVLIFAERPNVNFSLLKYVDTLSEAMIKFQTKQCNIQKAILFTNDYFVLTPDNKLELNNRTPKALSWYYGMDSVQLKEIVQDDSIDILNFRSFVPNAKFYQFEKDVVPILVKQGSKLTAAEIEVLLNNIIFAVGQPDDKKLTEIIKEDIKTLFKLTNPDQFYNDFEFKTKEWCDQIISSFPPVITFSKFNEYLQKAVKNDPFNFTPPTNSFTGRSNELYEIKKILIDTHDLSKTPCCVISGLGGIGKTQLAKHFVQSCKTEFYGRVCWISAESNSSVEKSFRRLAQRLKISNYDDIIDVIDAVFDYFNGLNVLFVFDNFDKTPEGTSLVVRCCNKSGASKYRPHFLLTSRNKDCLPSLPPTSSIKLNALTLDEAVDLITGEFKSINYAPESQLMKNLANSLQCFPLALQQAIAYIKQKRKAELNFKIQNYLIEFDTRKREILEFPLPNGLDDYEKTTFITWNVTLTAVEKVDIHGQDAIELLQIMSYLYADEIDRQMFLDSSKSNKEKIYEAFYLLEKYSMITKIDGDLFQIHRLVQTVVQLSVSQNHRIVNWPLTETGLIESSTRMIIPEIFQRYEERKLSQFTGQDLAEHSARYYQSLERCEMTHGLHLDALYVHVLKHEDLLTKYKELYKDIRLGAILKPAFNDDLESVKKLIQSDRKVLIWLLRSHSYELVQRDCMKVLHYFINNRLVKLGTRYHHGTLLYTAITLGKTNFVQYLLDNGAKPSPLEGGELSLSVSLNNYEIFAMILPKTVIGPLFSESHCFLQDNDTSFDFLDGYFNNPCDINLRSADGITLLHIAVHFDCRNCVRKLVNFSADVNIQDIQGETPLYYALKLRKVGIVKILLEAGPNLNLRTKTNDSVLKLAVREKFLKICRSMLQKGADIYDLCKDASKSLADAAITGDLNSLKDIMSTRNTIGSYKYDEEISFFATINDKADIVEYLIDRNIYPTDKLFNWTPKNIVIEFECLKTLELLLRETSTKDLNNVMFGFINNDDFDKTNVFETVFTAFVGKGGDVNTRDNSGNTLLCLATNMSTNNLRKLEIVEFLLKEGADMNLANSKDMTPLNYLCLETEFQNLSEANPVFDLYKRLYSVMRSQTSLSNVEKCLFMFFDNYHANRHEFRKLFTNFCGERQGDVHVSNVNGETFLHLCVKNFLTSNATEDLNFIRHLVDDCHINVDVVDRKGNTALYYAVHIFNNRDMFEFLAQKVTKVDERILMEAIKLNQMGVVEALFPNIRDTNYRFQDGRTPLEVAIELNQEEIVKFLEARNG